MAGEHSGEAALNHDLDAAYEHCRVLTRTQARNFYYGFITLPPARRRAIYAVYAFCRLCDDAADETDDPAEQLRRVAHQRQLLGDALNGRPRGPVYTALADATRQFAIPGQYLGEIVNGVEMDATMTRYRTFAELEGYCYRVACCVGLVCLEIFGYSDPGARRHAVDLGMAMQLTNILRDIAEDAGRGRIYIPLEDLDRFQLAESEILNGSTSDRFRDLMRFQVERARAYFDTARQLFPLLPVLSRACPAMLEATYSRLLDRIEDRDYDIYQGRVSLGTVEKLLLVARIWPKVLAPSLGP
ncbi:MAG: presqualene diphosphate synthase HpnD [Chloroflexi bacterium]|nr:presqualene diphosphate synthase HpnD [Chloroflexota bacterium]